MIITRVASSRTLTHDFSLFFYACWNGLIIMMKSPLGSTCYPTHLSENAFRYKVSSQPRKLRTTHQQPLLFTQEISFTHGATEAEPKRQRHTAISLEGLTFQKFQ